MCWRTRTFTRSTGADRDFDSVHRGALAHVRGLARVEGVDVRSARLALWPAPLRRVGHAAREGIGENHCKSEASGLVVHIDLVTVGEATLEGVLGMEGDRRPADASRDLRVVREAVVQKPGRGRREEAE